MQEGDLVKIDLLVEHSGNRKSKEAWSRIKKDFEELTQQTNNSAMDAIIASLESALAHLDKSKFGEVAADIIVAKQLLHP